MRLILAMMMLVLLLIPVVLLSDGTVEICRQPFFDKNDPDAAKRWVCGPQTQPVNGYFVGQACLNRNTNTIYFEGYRWDGVKVHQFPVATYIPPYVYPFPGVENRLDTAQFVSVLFQVPDGGSCTLWVSDSPPNL